MTTTTTTTDDPERLWSVEEVAHYLGKSVHSLYKWRVGGIGPPAMKIGRHLRYDPADVRRWARSQRR
jgi:predicted DNA-binding transcriptional regulator AlpA